MGVVRLKTFLDICPDCDYYKIYTLKKWRNKYKTSEVAPGDIESFALYNSIVGKIRTLPEEYEDMDTFYSEYCEKAKGFKVQAIKEGSIKELISRELKGKEVHFFYMTGEDLNEIDTYIETCVIFCTDIIRTDTISGQNKAMQQQEAKKKQGTVEQEEVTEE